MQLPKPLSCSEVGNRRILKALLNHRLDADFEDRILAHLRICPRCLSIVATVLAETGMPEQAGDDYRLDEMSN